MIDSNTLTRANKIHNGNATYRIKGDWTIMQIATFIDEWDAITAKLRKYYKKGDKNE